MPTHFKVLERKVYTCEHCGEKVVGGRYNNHCPKCLWSKHLDKEIPGDRASDCMGLMKPMGLLKKGDKFRIKHKCIKCEYEFIVDAQTEDNQEEIIRLSVIH